MHLAIIYSYSQKMPYFHEDKVDTDAGFIPVSLDLFRSEQDFNEGF